MFEMSFRSGKDGALVFGGRPEYKEEYLKQDYKKIHIKAGLGEMFIDFISLKGNIQKSNHPFLLVANDTCEGITEDSAFLVLLKEYIDLGIENQNFFDESCFMFFLSKMNMHIPAIHHTMMPLGGHEHDAVENYIEKTAGMSDVEKSMRGFIAAGNKVYDLPLTTYDCETVEDACIASLHFITTHGYNIRKCKNCGKYFIPLRSDAIYCNRISPHNTRRTCKEDGSLRAHENNIKEDPIKDLMKHKKNAKYMQMHRNRKDMDIQKNYEIWMDTLKQKKKDYESGAITAEQFTTWLSES